MCEGTVGVSPSAQTGPAPFGRVQRTTRIECALRETAATSEISAEIGDSCVDNDDPGRHAPPVPAQRASQVADGVSDGGAEVRMVHTVSKVNPTWSGWEWKDLLWMQFPSDGSLGTGNLWADGDSGSDGDDGGSGDGGGGDGGE